MTTPVTAFGRSPLKGAKPAARQSRFRGVCSIDAAEHLQ